MFPCSWVTSAADFLCCRLPTRPRPHVFLMVSTVPHAVNLKQAPHPHFFFFSPPIISTEQSSTATNFASFLFFFHPAYKNVFLLFLDSCRRKLLLLSVATPTNPSLFFSFFYPSACLKHQNISPPDFWLPTPDKTRRRSIIHSTKSV